MAQVEAPNLMTPVGYDPSSQLWPPFQLEPYQIDGVNQEEYARLIVAMRRIIPIALVNTVQTNVTAWTGGPFSTDGLEQLAIDINVTAITGGTTPTVNFNLQRQMTDGVTWQTCKSGTAISAAGVFQMNVGPGQPENRVLARMAQLIMVLTGAPTGVSFNASVWGK